MVHFILLTLLLSHSTGNSSSCWGKISLGLSYSKDTVYTYQNKISSSTWIKGNESDIKNSSNTFQTIIYPYSKTKDGYLVYETVINAQNNELLELIGKRPQKLPGKYLQPIYPVGQTEGTNDQSPAQVKQIGCEQVFTSYENYNSYDESINVSKKSINKIIESDTIKVAGKKLQLFRMESRKEVDFKGRLTGTGTETTTLYLISGTNELYEQKTSFIYEYKTGTGKERRTETMKGSYAVKLLGKKKYTKKKKSFPELTEATGPINYYTNNNGLFIPVELSGGLEPKMYINTSNASSFIDYDYYIKNYEGEPKDYFYPFDSIKIGKSKLENPGIEILSPLESGLNLDYKIPGSIGKDIISIGALRINDTKRQLLFWEPEEKVELPDKAVPFELIDGNPIFELMVNGSTVKATIGFDCYTPEISYNLQQKLKLKTIKVAVPKGNNPMASFIYKADLIITPSSKDYFKTAAVVKDFGREPYDIKLGLNYIKDKDITIDYKNGWFLIK